MLAFESFSRVEVTAFFTAQGPVSISVGTVLRKRKLLAVGDEHMGTVERWGVTVVVVDVGGGSVYGRTVDDKNTYCLE